jgi:hypothetical protein
LSSPYFYREKHKWAANLRFFYEKAKQHSFFLHPKKKKQEKSFSSSEIRCTFARHYNKGRLPPPQNCIV